MKRRYFLKTALMGSASLGYFSLGTACHRTRRKPNIVLIMADDLGYGDLGCYGNREIKTPNIDALSRNGLRFTDYHSNGAVCSPTRTALLTGRYQQRAGLEGVIYANGETRQTGLSLNEITFAEALRKADYATAITGKWHLGYRVDFNPVKQGFDEFWGYVSGNVDYISHIDGAGYSDWWHNSTKTPEEGYSTDLITKHSVEFIEKNKDRPFCLYVSHEAPHFPYQGRNDPAIRVQGKKISGNKKNEHAKIAYRQMIEAMDDGVGRIVSTIKKLGLAQNTFIFFCSDNGAIRKVGSNGVLNGSKGGLWEGGHRVPAIACWPGKIKPGTTTDQITLSMDLFPTLLALADLPAPAGLKLDGVNLLPSMLSNKKLPDRYVFWRYRGQKVARRGKWKLFINKKNTLLFDLSNDLEETKNLADEYPDLVVKMKTALVNWEKDVSAGVLLKTK